MATASYSITELSTGEVLSKAWLVLKENWKELGKLLLITFLVTTIPSAINEGLFGGTSIGGLIDIALQIWSMFVGMGLMKGTFNIVRGKTVEIPAIFENQSSFLEYFIMMLRMAIILIPAYLALIIPGIYFSLRYLFVPFLVIDGKATGAEAFAKSKEMTEGKMGALFIYYVIGMLLIIAGIFALIVGMFVASAVVSIGTFLIYEYLMKNGASAK